MMRALLSAIFIFQLPVMVWAHQEVCFRNQGEYEAVKAQLPGILQEIPVYLSAKNFLVTAAVSIKFENEQTRFFFNCTREIEEPIEDSILICATDQEIRLIFDNEVVEKVSIKGPDQVNLRGLLLMNKTTEDGFNKMARLIDEKTAPNASQTPSRNREAVKSGAIR